MQHSLSKTTHWWSHPNFTYVDGVLSCDGHDLTQLAGYGTPAYVYSGQRVIENLEMLHKALSAESIPYKIFYAVKANRNLPLVTFLRLSGLCGMDVCSPNEVAFARQVGFAERDISFTGNSVSNADLDRLALYSEIAINCDSLSTLGRLGERCSGRDVGLRVNPQLGAGYSDKLHYAGEKPTKFGIYPDRFDEALQMADRYGMTVKTLHFHIGSGYLNEGLDTLDQILAAIEPMLDRCATIQHLDIGGGFGKPQTAADEPLDLAAWAEIIGRYARQYNVEIQIEPGDFIVKDAGFLLVEANTVEEKQGTTFVGVNAGFNLGNHAAYYDLPVIIAPLVERDGAAQAYTVVGNINESIDVWAENILLPPVREGDQLAIHNIGGYGSSNSSNHCMRGDFTEYFLPPHD